MTYSGNVVLSRGCSNGWDNDLRFVCPDEFIEEPVPMLWLDDAIDIDVSQLEGPPGAGLAAVLAGTTSAGLDGDGLLTAISAWRRLGSWAKSGELEAAAAFLARRTSGRPGTEVFESAVSEVQLELTLTGVGAGRLLELACPLADRLPATMHALRAGLIDETKARVIARAVDGVLDATAAASVEERVLPKAPAQTTGQLRHAVERAAIEADPDAAERRRRHAETGRRVEIRPTDAHTADLCGRDLPADQALAADNRITALATALKHDGDPNSLTFLRAQVFLALLLGTGPVPAWPPAHDLPCDPGEDEIREDGADGDGTAGDQTGTPGHPSPGAGVTGTVHVIIPIGTLRGTSAHPGEVPGYGAVPASLARAIAARATGQRWCYTILDQAGRPVGHGHTRPHGGDTGHREFLAEVTVNLEKYVISRECEPETRRPAGSETDVGGQRPSKDAYRPPDSLRHLIEIRDRTCRFPACRRPARRCDIDHTIPYKRGGPTCECNLAPLCRRHHRLKQAHGWTLIQPEPGELIWVTPSGRRYPVTADPYPT
jgi:hypothetical protein